MSHPIVTYDDARDAIGQLPSLGPRPTATNIRALVVDLVDKLTIIPSEQAPDLGYAGMAEQEATYALSTNTPWTNWPNPGAHRATDPNWTTTEQKDADVLYDANKRVFDSEANVRRAVISALNEAVPRKYKRAGGNAIGVKIYKPSDCPRTILNVLRTNYGKLGPAEKTENERKWSEAWNPSEPIEELFDRLEECYVLALVNKPEYTQEQMIDKALMAVQSTGLYATAVLEWNGFDANNQTWAEFKAHFSEAYDIRLQSGTGMGNSYHGAANAIDGDDDSLGSITQSITNMHMAYNVNAQAMNDNMSTITAETASLRAALLATQQQLAMMANAPAQPAIIQAHAAYAPAPAPYAPSPAPWTQYAPPATAGVPPPNPPDSPPTRSNSQRISSMEVVGEEVEEEEEEEDKVEERAGMIDVEQRMVRSHPYQASKRCR